MSKVIIEIKEFGAITQKPDDVEVEIRDYRTDKSQNNNIKIDDANQSYIEILFPAKKDLLKLKKK